MAVQPRKWRILRVSWWRRQLGTGRLVGLAALFLLLVLRATNPTLLNEAEVRVFDFYQSLKPREIPPDRPIMIVDLDEDSLHELGQWPWPRTLVAKLVDNLVADGAIVIGFDIVFAEPDRVSPSTLAKTFPTLDPAILDKLKGMPSNDEALAASMKKARVVVGQAGIDLPPRRTKNIPPIPTVAQVGGDPKPYLTRFTSMLRNIPEIDNAASGWGSIVADPDSDGIVRRVPAMVTDGTNIYPSLATDMLRIATANESLGVKMDEAGVYGVIVRPNIVKTDEGGRIWLYASNHDPAKYIPAKDVINGTVDKTKLANKLVLVGTSAVGLQDIRTIAVAGQIPGVELHAQIMETVLYGQQLSRPSDAVGVEMVAAIVGALLMIILIPLVGARWTLLLLAIVIGGACGFSWYEFSRKLHMYDAVFPSLTTLLTFILVTYSSYAREEAQKRQVRAAFNRYLAPAVVEQIAADPSKLVLGGEQRDMTLLFCDIRGFTTISELFDAHGLTLLINKFLTPMTDIILARQGAIDKYMGDCIMAYWNAPLDDPDHARHACASALAMNERLAPLNDQLEAEAKAENRRHVPIKIGIGLNSGPVVVGNVGSDQFFGYSSLGDNVNLASRLEGQSKGYGVIIVIGENTYQRAPDYACLELDLIKVKGKTEAVRIYTVVGAPEVAQSDAFKALKAEHDLALAAYRAQKWDEAKRLQASATKLAEPWHIEHYYEIFGERVAEYEQNSPGADWDGVYVATSK
ncbi:MAG TPA: adenylate/guanylate cyclase domain-containing protein [Magnetospirillaceae bacterium]|jgi:adenylate cyclase